MILLISEEQMQPLPFDRFLLYLSQPMP